MILYTLKCRKNHTFEAWFRDSAAYDEQAKAGTVICPTCGSRKVEKALMAPRVARGGHGDEPAPPPRPTKAVMETEQTASAMRALRELRRKVEETCDYVGPEFAEEARRIHYGERDPRNIYGETSDDEATALREEGVSFGRVPWPARES